MARKAGVTIESIVATASEIADRDGVEAASLGAVAAAVGIKTPSLHYRVNGTKGLRRLLALEASLQLTASLRAAANEADAMRSMGHALRSFALQHPGLYDSLLPAPQPGDDDELSAAMNQSAMVFGEVLLAGGVPEGALIPTIRALRSAVHGFADLERKGGFGLPIDLDESFEAMLDLVLASVPR